MSGLAEGALFFCQSDFVCHVRADWCFLEQTGTRGVYVRTRAATNFY
jgi:hypothetical protein